jgi:hypothetical protein
MIRDLGMAIAGRPGPGALAAGARPRRFGLPERVAID